ncbi:MAG: fructan beta-fructosidase [Oleiphilaceae bacterium]
MNRPKFHFHANGYWMNDPNGLIEHEGTFHLFYQNNSKSANWGKIGWGHAISSDLISWEVLDPAILPYDDVMIFSGCAVYDEFNLSALGTNNNPPMLAYYTEAKYEWEGQDKIKMLHQTQCISYSIDKGMHWLPYKKNPILDIESSDFRDPKVFAYDSGWIMAVALSAEHKIRFYRSDDLLSWQYLSDFSVENMKLGVWECPDLFPITLGDETRWILMFGVSEDGSDSGSKAFYCIGDFNGKTFTVDSESMGGHLPFRLDYGQDFFASQSFFQLKQRSDQKIMIGWLNNWLYAKKMPVEHSPCLQSIPREVTLNKENGLFRLHQWPVKELLSRRKAKSAISDRLLPSSHSEQLCTGLSSFFDIELEISLGETTHWQMRLKFSELDFVILSFDALSGTFSLDRKYCSPDIEGLLPLQEISLPPHSCKLSLRLIFDYSAIEVFLMQGQYVLSSRVSPQNQECTIEMSTRNEDAKLTRFELWELQ